MESTEIVPTIPKYLEDELNEIAKNDQFFEYSIHVHEGSKHGDGFMATMLGVTIAGQQYHNGVKINYELPLICKLLPNSIVRREIFSSVFIFEREVYFYKTVLPLFRNFLEEKNIADEEFSVYPKCFVALCEPTLDRHVIVMENLKTLGYDLWPKTKPIDFDAAAKVLTELGKFHALSFAMYDQKRDIYDERFRITEPFDEMFKGNGAPEVMVSGAIQQTIDVLDDKVEIEVMQKVKDNYQTWLKEYLSSDAAGRFSVLNHGDFWNNNMMYKLDSNHQHRQLRFVDFQLLRLASPTIDVLDDKVEIEVMQKVKDNYQTWLKEYLSSDAAGRFSVLNHGDFWNNNMMYKLDSNHQHRQLRFVDFQLLRLASPAIDISYYFCTSLGLDIHQRYKDLLTIYYDSLARFLTKMGSDPQNLFTFDDLEDQLRQFGKYGLIFSPILAGVMVSDSKDIIDLDTFKRDTKADGLATLNDQTKILLKERMSSAIQLIIKWGCV